MSDKHMDEIRSFIRNCSAILKATDTVESEPVDLNRINQIIDGKKYDCELKWR